MVKKKYRKLFSGEHVTGFWGLCDPKTCDASNGNGNVPADPSFWDWGRQLQLPSEGRRPKKPKRPKRPKKTMTGKTLGVRPDKRKPREYRQNHRYHRLDIIDIMDSYHGSHK